MYESDRWWTGLPRAARVPPRGGTNPAVGNTPERADEEHHVVVSCGEHVVNWMRQLRSLGHRSAVGVEKTLEDGEPN